MHSPPASVNFYFAQLLDLFACCVRLSRLLVGSGTHYAILFHFISFHTFHFIATDFFTLLK